MKIAFSPPDITEEEIQEVAETLRSGWITTGPRTKEFERRIAERCRDCMYGDDAPSNGNWFRR